MYSLVVLDTTVRGCIESGVLYEGLTVYQIQEGLYCLAVVLEYH